MNHSIQKTTDDDPEWRPKLSEPEGKILIIGICISLRLQLKSKAQ